MARAKMALLVGALACGACKLNGGLEIEAVAVTATPPSNVAIYLGVAQDGQSVPGLQVNHFQLTENGIRLDNQRVGLTVLPSEALVFRQAVVLVDVSRAQTRVERASLTKNLRRFVSKLRQRQAVAVYAFDGSETVHFIARFDRAARAEPREEETSLGPLLEFELQDPSTSLYSAVLTGVAELDTLLSQQALPVRLGTIVVVAHSPDLAGRISEDRVRDLVDDSQHRFYLVTVGPWAQKANIEWLGREGVESAISAGVLGTSLDRLAKTIDDVLLGHYLLAYCSPARGGKRALTLQVETADEQGQPVIATYDTEFDASGFGPGCDAATLSLRERAKAPEAESASPKPNKPEAPPRRPKAPPRKPKAKIVSPPSGLGYE
jgi:hypothetical protein